MRAAIPHIVLSCCSLAGFWINVFINVPIRSIICHYNNVQFVTLFLEAKATSYGFSRHKVVRNEYHYLFTLKLRGNHNEQFLKIKLYLYSDGK